MNAVAEGLCKFAAGLADEIDSRLHGAHRAPASASYQGDGIIRRFGALIVTVLALAAPAAAAPPDWQHQWRKWLPPVWQRIGKCETGLNWQHRTRDYQGAFGFYHGSWDAFRLRGYPTEAYLATPWQQYMVARRIHARYGFTGWGCYRHDWVRNGG